MTSVVSTSMSISRSSLERVLSSALPSFPLDLVHLISSYDLHFLDPLTPIPLQGRRHPDTTIVDFFRSPINDQVSLWQLIQSGWRLHQLVFRSNEYPNGLTMVYKNYRPPEVSEVTVETRPPTPSDHVDPHTTMRLSVPYQPLVTPYQIGLPLRAGNHHNPDLAEWIFTLDESEYFTCIEYRIDTWMHYLEFHTNYGRICRMGSLNGKVKSRLIDVSESVYQIECESVKQRAGEINANAEAEGKNEVYRPQLPRRKGIVGIQFSYGGHIHSIGAYTAEIDG